MRHAIRLFMAFALICLATPLRAAETGSISGTVTDSTGAPVPGAAVKITGAQAPRDTVTAASGAFKFSTLLPGNYVVTAELKGLGTTSQQVKVFVDNPPRLLISICIRGNPAAFAA